MFSFSSARVKDRTKGNIINADLNVFDSVFDVPRPRTAI
jgi:hypothetical protein